MQMVSLFISVVWARQAILLRFLRKKDVTEFSGERFGLDVVSAGASKG